MFSHKFSYKNKRWSIFSGENSVIAYTSNHMLLSYYSLVCSSWGPKMLPDITLSGRVGNNNRSSSCCHDHEVELLPRMHSSAYYCNKLIILNMRIVKCCNIRHYNIPINQCIVGAIVSRSF